MTLTDAILIFVCSTVVIGLVGTALTKKADQLADLTGLGEAAMGALFLGSVTSLSGIATSVSAALQNHPELAASNAIGGIAVQTVFLAVADITYKRSNLEHASASFSNLMQAAFLIAMLSFVAFGSFAGNVSFFGVHPVSPLLILFYLMGQRLIYRAGRRPMWNPVQTGETQRDIPDGENLRHRSMSSVLAWFLILAVIIAVAGIALTRAAIFIANNTALSEGIMGALFTSLSTSLPELVVAVSAVRQKALTLAVSNIIGGNAFDVLLLVFSDMAYLPGSILQSFTAAHYLVLMLSILMTSVLLMGLLHREKRGVGGVGWESVTILALFAVGYMAMFFAD